MAAAGGRGGRLAGFVCFLEAGGDFLTLRLPFKMLSVLLAILIVCAPFCLQDSADAFLPLFLPLAGGELAEAAIMALLVAACGYGISNYGISFDGVAHGINWPWLDDQDPQAELYNEALYDYAHEVAVMASKSDNPAISGFLSNISTQYASGVYPGDVVSVPRPMLDLVRNYVAERGIGTYTYGLQGLDDAGLTYDLTGSLADIFNNYADYGLTELSSHAPALVLPLNPNATISYDHLNFVPKYITITTQGIYAPKPYSGSPKPSAYMSYSNFYDIDCVNGCIYSSVPQMCIDYARSFSDFNRLHVEFFRSALSLNIYPGTSTATNYVYSIGGPYLRENYDVEKYILPDGTTSKFVTAEMSVKVSAYGESGEVTIADGVSYQDAVDGLTYNPDTDTYDVYAPGTDVCSYAELDGISIPLITELSYDQVVGDASSYDPAVPADPSIGILEQIKSSVVSIPASIASAVSSLFVPAEGELEASIDSIKTSLLDHFPGLDLDFAFFDADNGRAPQNLKADFTWLHTDHDNLTIVDYSEFISVVGAIRPYIRGFIVFCLLVWVVNQVLLLMGHSTLTQGAWAILSGRSDNGKGRDND